MKRYFPFIFISLALLVSCTLLDLAPSVQPSPSETSQPQTPVESPTDVPTEELIDPVCVPLDETVVLGVAVDFDEYPQIILNFLNRGGTGENLDSQLYDAGIANQPITLSLADMTGNGKDDFVVSIFDPQSSHIAPGGTLMIFTCQNDSFTLALELKSEDLFGAPGIRYLQDLDSDNLAELVSGSPTCGAHTCFEDVGVWAWTGTEFQNRLMGTTIEIPYPDIRIGDDDLDGCYQVELVSAGYGSVGAGAQRTSSWVWDYDPDLDQWYTAGPVFAPANFRIHVVHDADEAVRNGDYQGALVLYQRVIVDQTLSDWIDPEVERANLSAYAYYKMIVVYYTLDSDDFAQLTYEQMRESVSVDDDAYAYVMMAEAFREAYLAEGLVSGCEHAQGFARGESELILDPLGPGVFGYANPEFTLEDLCP